MYQFHSTISDAEARILDILARDSQGRVAGSPATLKYLGVYMSADGWKGGWSDVSYAIRNLKRAGKLVSHGNYGTDEILTLA